MYKEGSPIPIERGGGKLEATRALEEAGFPVPKSRYLYYPDLERQNILAAAFRDLPKPLIVRGSHENDMHGYIDVLPTVRDVTTAEELNDAIRLIKQTASSEALRIHAADWGQPFTPEVHVLLQEQSPSNIAGSILRHPHVMDRVDMQYIDRKEYRESDWKPVHTLARYTNDQGLWQTHEDWGIAREQISNAMKIYQEVESSGIIDPDWVYQMEIGLNPFLIYQLRPFKRREPAKRFPIPQSYKTTDPIITSNLVFGITPEEGLALNFVSMDSVSLYHGYELPEPDPYGLILAGRMYESLPARVQYRNLKAYVTTGYEHNYLEHGEYRFLKRADIAMVNYHAFNVGETRGSYHQPEDFNPFKRARIWSNGDDASILPE